MAIKLDLSYQTSDGKQAQFYDWILKPSVKVEITLNQINQNKKNYIIGFPCMQSEPQLLATLQISRDNALEIVNHSKDENNVVVVYSLENEIYRRNVGYDKSLALSRAYRYRKENQLQEQDIYFSKIILSFHGVRLAEISVDIKQFFLDEERMRLGRCKIQGEPDDNSLISSLRRFLSDSEKILSQQVTVEAQASDQEWQLSDLDKNRNYVVMAPKNSREIRVYTSDDKRKLLFCTHSQEKIEDLPKFLASEFEKWKIALSENIKIENLATTREWLLEDKQLQKKYAIIQRENSRELRIYRRFSYDEILDEYRILDRITEDEYSPYTVYKADHKQIDKMDVIIKKLNDDITRSDGSRKVLERMKTILTHLSGHPHIPPVLQIVEKELGGRSTIVFIIMKYIDGMPLNYALQPDRLVQSPLTMGEILDIMIKLADVLEYLHKNEIAHRGVAPCNVLINRRSNTLHLVGFGNSKLFWGLHNIDAQNEDGWMHSITPMSIRRSISAQVLDFMPPEFFNAPATFHYRGDIYSFGAVFFRMLLGFAPHWYKITKEKRMEQDRFIVYENFAEEKSSPPNTLQVKKWIEANLKKQKEVEKKLSHFLAKEVKATEEEKQVLAEQIADQEKELLPEELRLHFRRTIDLLQNIDEDILEDAAGIIARCLEFEPGKRFDNMGELRRELEPLIIRNSYRDLEAGRFKRYIPLHTESTAGKEYQIKELSYRRDLQEKINEIRNIRAQVEHWKNESSQLEKEKKHKQKIVEGLQNEIKQRELDYRDKLAQMTKELQEQSQNVQNLKKDEDTKRARLGEMLEESLDLLAKHQEQLVDRDNKLKTIEEENKQITDELKDITHQLNIFHWKEVKSRRKNPVQLCENSPDQMDIIPSLKPKLPGSHGVYYIIEKEIGAGGMGVVFEATRVFGDEREKVALKLLQIPDDREIEAYFRFWLETYIIMNAVHPSLMEGIDYVQHKKYAYYVARYIEGETIKNLILQRMTIPPQETRKIILKIAEGLSYLHQQQLCHRDIKDTNIIVCPNGEVKIIDFGISYHQKEFPGRITGPQDGVRGTVEYMPPERLYGEIGDIRSDIYSLGILYFLMLTGELPFTGELGHIINQQLNSIAQYPSNMPRADRKIIERMIKKSPNKRYANPERLISDLQKIL